MAVIFHTMEVKNFLSIGWMVLHFDQGRLTLILGENRDGNGFDSNGAGKSSILEAFLWGLYGKTVRGIKADEVVNRMGDGSVSVAIRFSSSGRDYAVCRSRENGRMTLMIACDGRIVDRGTYLRNQEVLEQILGMDWDTFLSSSVFCHNYANAFLSGGDARRKEILEKILGLDIFTQCQERVKSLLEETTRQSGAVDGALQVARNLPERLRGDLESLRRLFQETEKRLLLKKQSLEQECLRVSEELVKKRETVTDLEAEVGTLEESLKRYRTEVQPRLERLRQERVNLEGLLRERLVLQRLAEKKVADLRQKIERLTESYLHKPCPTCRRLITEEELPVVLATTTGELQTVLQELEQVRGQVRQATEELEAATEKVQSLEAEVEAESRLPELEQRRQRLWQETTACRELEGKLAMTEKALASLNVEQELESLRGLITAKEQELQEAVRRISELEAKQKEFQSQLQVLSFWKNGFGNGGVKAWVINSYLNWINERLAFYLAELGFGTLQAALRPVFVNRGGMEVDRLELELRNGEDTSYLSLSSGERRRVDLAVLFTLQELVAARGTGQGNVFFYDEVFDALDAVGVECVVQLLKRLHPGKTVLVVSHNSELKPYFDHYLTVVKENGVSRLGN